MTYFQLIALKHVLASSHGQSTVKDERGSIRKAFVLDDSFKKKTKVGVFFSSSLKITKF